MISVFCVALALVGSVPLTTAERAGGTALAADGTARFVWLRGVATYVDPSRGLIVQDATGGVRVRGAVPARVVDGDEVVVVGMVDRGVTPPQVLAARVDRLGPADARPAPTSFDLSAGRAAWLDGAQVVAKGTVYAAKYADGFTRLTLYTSCGAAVALIPGPAPGVPTGDWLGAVVSVRGVCSAGHDYRLMSTGPPQVYLPGPSAVTVVGRPAAAAAPTVPAWNVAEVAARWANPKAPVTVTGVVTARWGRRTLFVQDGTGGVAVALAEFADAADVPVGEWVDVTGPPAADGAVGRLDFATIRRVPPAGPAPEPAPIDRAHIAAVRGLLIRAAGQVVDVARGPDRVRVSVLANGRLIDAYLQTGPGLPPLAGVEPGARVEVVGVCTGGRLSGDVAGGEEVLLRTPADLTVSAPARPGEATQGWYVPAGFGVVAGLGSAWAVLLRCRARRAVAEARKQADQLEEQVRQTADVEAVGRLAGGIAHDFNNLLQVINGSAELLRDHVPAPTPAAAALAANIRDAGEQAAALAGQILTYSHRQDAEPRPVDLNAAVRDVARLLARVIRADVEVRTHLAPGLPPARADRGLIGRVLLNLAVNARDAMPGGGTLTIATGPGLPPGGGWVRLTVADTGEGMTDEVRARAFERFFTTKPPGKGTGLGLATVSDIVRSLGGRIDLDTAPGRGTRFDIDLPAEPAPPPVSVSVATPLPRVLDVGGRPVVVLLVEDDDGVRSVAVRFLEMRGMTALPAESPEQALRLAAEFPDRIDVLVTDVVMPGMDGRELAERVRAGRPDLKVVFMSGYAAEEIQPRGGVDPRAEFLPKPFNPAQLTAAVARALAADAGDAPHEQP